MYQTSMLYYSNNNFERAYQLKKICQGNNVLLVNVNDCVDLFIKLSQLKPSVVFMDLSQFDHLNEIIEEIKGNGEPTFKNLKLVGICDSFNQTEIVNKDVSIIRIDQVKDFLDKFEVDEVVETQKIFQNFKLDYTKVISDALLSLGVNPKHTGYVYLKSIINYLMIRNSVNYVISDCYEMVSGIYRVSPGSVERSVRNAISIAWDNYGKEGWKERLFGGLDKKPTSREFINLVIEKMNVSNFAQKLGYL